MICDGGGIPLAVRVTGGNRNDVTQLMPLVEAIPPVRGRRGRPRRTPDALVADRGYDHDTYLDALRKRGIHPLISRRGTRDSNQAVRWVVEQTLALLHQFRRLNTRWERRTDIHHSRLTLATSLICRRRPPQPNTLGALSGGVKRAFFSSRPRTVTTAATWMSLWVSTPSTTSPMSLLSWLVGAVSGVLDTVCLSPDRLRNGIAVAGPAGRPEL